MKKKFPYQIHIILGIIWILVGLILYSGIESVVWTAGGLIMAGIGVFNRKDP